jgi:hypothetical protein
MSKKLLPILFVIFILTAAQLRAQDLVLSDGTRVVLARDGETVAEVAARSGADPVEMAKRNGLLPSTKLKFLTKIFLPPVACSKTLAESPEIRGIKLGMAESTFIALLNNRRQYDFSMTRFYPGIDFKDPDRYEGVQTVSVDFVNAKLYEFQVNYTGVSWDNSGEFIDNISQNFKLPRDAWRTDRDGDYQLDCGDFSIKANTNEIHLQDRVAEKAKLKAERAAEQKKKEVFKP